MKFRKRADVSESIVGKWRRWLSECGCYRVSEIKRALAGERGKRGYYAERRAPVFENGDPTQPVTGHVWKVISTHKKPTAAREACLRHLNDVAGTRGRERERLEI